MGTQQIHCEMLLKGAKAHSLTCQGRAEVTNRATELHPLALKGGDLLGKHRCLLTQLLCILLGHLGERTELLRANNRLRISINISAKGLVTHQHPTECQSSR